MPPDDTKTPSPIPQQPDSKSSAENHPGESCRPNGGVSPETVEAVSGEKTRGIGGREKGKKHNYPKNRATPNLLRRRVANKVTRLSPAQKQRAEEMQKVLVIGTGALVGLRQDRIAEEAGVSRRVVPEYLAKLAPIFPKIQEIAEYKQFREQVMQSVEQSALESVMTQLTSCNPDDKLRDKAYAFDVLHRAGRLERGASTSNVSVKAKYTEVALDAYEEDTPSE